MIRPAYELKLFKCLQEIETELLANILHSYSIVSMCEHVRHMCFVKPQTENTFCLHEENPVPVLVHAGLKI